MELINLGMSLRAEFVRSGQTLFWAHPLIYGINIMIELTDKETGRRLSLNPDHIVFVETRNFNKRVRKRFLFWNHYGVEIDGIKSYCAVWMNSIIWNFSYKAAVSVCHKVGESQKEVEEKVKDYYREKN